MKELCALELCNWLTKLAPVCQPVRSKTKTNRDFLAHVLPRLGPDKRVFASNVNWLIAVFASVVIG